MSTFWDSIKASTVQYPAKVDTLTLENVWDNIPEQSLVELVDGCYHHFTIPTSEREVIGQCKKCNGERWFKNYFEEIKFNRTAKPAEQVIAEQDMQSDGLTVSDLDTVGGLV